MGTRSPFRPLQTFARRSGWLSCEIHDSIAQHVAFDYLRAHGTAKLPEIYANNQEQLFADITATYIEAVHAFYDLGCRNLQLDDTSWGEFCSEEKRALYASQGVDVDAVAKRYVQMLNDIRAAAPQDMAITMHICRGNFRSTWFSSGGYEPIAEILFGGCNVDGFIWNTTATAQAISNPCVSLKSTGCLGIGNVQIGRIGRQASHHRPHSRSRAICGHQPTVFKPAMRFRLHRRRQCVERRRTMAKTELHS